MSSTLPAIVRLPKDPSTDLSAIQDRTVQLGLIESYQSRTIRRGMITIALFFVGLVGWSATIPLSGAIVAMGEIKVVGRNKPVQHYGGGIVAEVLVKDGQLVEQGDVLVRLDKVREGASAAATEGRYLAMLAQESRLLAERDDQAAIAYGPEIIQRKAEPEVAALIEAQQKVFDARREARLTQTRILTQRVEQLNEEIQGFRAQLRGVAEQLALVKDEVGMVSELFREGLTNKSRLLALQRQQAGLVGQKGGLESNVARTEQRISETRMQIQSVRDESYSRIVEELRAVQIQLRELREQRVVAVAINQRTEVRAPIAGYVQNLNVAGVGQVVGNGEPMMEIVPKDQPLVSEIRLKPDDIDEIQVGQVAEVKLNIYSSRVFSKKIDGRVVFIAADKSQPKAYGEMQMFPGGFYKASIEIDREQMEAFGKEYGIQLYPGAPTTVIVPTMARTALEYFVGPVIQGLETAFRER